MEKFDQIFNLPPHLIARWDEVKALFKEGDRLIVLLSGHSRIEIPGLSPEIEEKLFLSYAKFLENDQKKEKSPLLGGIIESIKIPLPFPTALFGGESPFEIPFKVSEGFHSITQHDQAEADAPDLPPEVLHRLTQLAKMLSNGNQNLFSDPQPHCNCFHCQVGRSVKAVQNEEVVPEADLSFQQWEVIPTDESEKRFRVINRLDPSESYQVFLGNPIGCTCGKKECEHIIAALKS